MNGDALRSTIGTLRIRSQCADTPQLRLAVGSRVRSFDVEPASLPPAAVLIVRRVSDPQPGKLGSGGFGVDQRWAGALRQQLDGLLRTAVRPYRGRVADGADAIVFRDEAELLACLCADLAAGRVSTRWWWRQFVAPLPTAQPLGVTMRKRLMQRPETIAAAVSLMLERGQMTSVLAALEEDDAAIIVTAMLRAHDLASLAGRLDAAPIARVQGGHVTTTNERQRPPDETSSASKSPPVLRLPAPLHGALLRARLDPGTVPAGRQLLPWLAVALSHAPDVLRQTTVQDELVAAYAASVYNGMPRLESPVDAPAPFESRIYAADPNSVAAAPEGRGVPPPETSLACADAAAPSCTAQEAAREGKAAPNDSLSSPSFDDDEQHAPMVSSLCLPDGIPTRLGGVLYLINLFERIGWPHDVCADAFRSRPPGPWCTIDAVARVLLGDRFDDSRGDGIWTSLAELDGRDPHEALGADLVLAGRATPPSDWPQPVGAKAAIAVDGGRYGLSAALAGWLSSTLASIELALEACDDAARDWVVCPGTLHVTRTHIDLVTSVDAISMPARLAGLDRDPGWCASLGRVVQFHFEGGGWRD